MAAPAVGTPGGVGYVNPFAPTALPNNGGAPTVPTPVPTAAPSAQASDKSTSPSAIISSKPAADKVTNVIMPAVAQATQALADHNANKAAAAQQNNGMNPTAEQLAARQTAASTPPTPEQQIADTPETGNKWIYSTSDASQRTQVPIGEVTPQGYSDTNPFKAPSSPMVNTIPLSDGTSIQQLADGTYARYNEHGQYLTQANSKEYTDAKNADDASKKIAAINNGTYPLSSDEQSQVNDLQSKWKLLISKQATDNANLTGGETVAQNLYGMGNTDTAKSAIQKTIDDGTAKISDLNSQMSAAVTAMKQSLIDGDYKRANDTYSTFNDAMKARQATLAKMNDDASTALKDAQARYDQQQKDQQTINDAADGNIRTAILDAQKNGASPDTIAAMSQALRNHDFGTAVSAAGDSLKTMTGDFADYPQYKKDAQASGLTPLDPTKWLAQQKAIQAKQDASKAYTNAFNSEAGRQAALAIATKRNDALGGYNGTTQKDQQGMEKTFIGTLSKEFSSRSGTYGLNDSKVSQANKLATLFNQDYDSKTDNYNISKAQYGELALGLANLISGSSGASDTQISDLKTATAKGDWNKIYTYVTGEPANGSTQDVINQLVMSVNREALQSVADRTTDEQKIKGMAPTDLDPKRVDALTSAASIPFIGIKGVAKSEVNNYVAQHKDQAASIAQMYDVPGATDEAIWGYLQKSQQ